MRFAARFKAYFLAGILVTAPISITLWLAWKVVGVVDRGIRPAIPPKFDPNSYLPFELPGFGILVVLVSLILVGALTKGFAGKLLIKYAGWLIGQVPVISSIYGWAKQIFETLLSEDSGAFREVVLIEYPYRGSWAVGFITGQTQGEVQDLTSETVYNVFVPATPNPTTGFLLFLPEREIHRLDYTIDEGIKLVISGGLVKPASEHEESTWGHGTGIGEDMERIKAQLEIQWAMEKQSAHWGRTTAFSDEVARIKTRMEAEHSTARSRVGPIGMLRDYLITGTLVTAPIAITIWLSLEVINYFDRTVLPLLPARWNPETYLPFGIPGLGLITAVLAMTLIGFLTASFIGNVIVGLGERLIEGLPVVRGLYSAVKQIFESLFKKQSKAFREVVLLQYPRPGVWAIGFITGDAAGGIRSHAPDDVINIFLPTTPNPTSGFLLFVPRSETRKLVMSVEQGLKMVISGGIVTPESGREAKEPAASAAQ